MRSWVRVPVEVVATLLEKLALSGEKWTEEQVIADLVVMQDAAIAEYPRQVPTVRKLAERWRWSLSDAGRMMRNETAWSDPHKAEKWRSYLQKRKRSGGDRRSSGSSGSSVDQARIKRNDRTPKMAENRDQNRIERGSPLEPHSQAQASSPIPPPPYVPPSPGGLGMHLPGQGQSPSRSQAAPAAQTARNGTSPPAAASSSAEVDVDTLQAAARPRARAAQAAAGCSEVGGAPGVDVARPPRGKQAKSIPLAEWAGKAIEAHATLAELEALRRCDRVALASLRQAMRRDGLAPAGLRLRELEGPAVEAAELAVLFADGPGLANRAHASRRRPSRPGGPVARGVAPGLGAAADDALGLVVDGLRRDVDEGLAARHATAIGAGELDNAAAFDEACAWLSVVRWALDHDVDEVREAARAAADVAALLGVDVRTVRP